MDAINITQNDFLDVLFDNRNKDYGAYSLRRQYERRMRNAVGITGAALLAMIAAYTVSNMMAGGKTVTIADVRRPPVVMDVIDLPKEKVEPLPPPPAAAAAPRALQPTIKNTIPTVVPNDTKDITPPPKQEEMQGKIVSSVTAAGDPNGADIDAPVDLNGTGNGGVKVETHSAEGGSDRPFTFVEVMPSYPGGEAALMKFLHNNVRYPNMAQENDIQGTVSVQFVVMSDGTIEGVKVIGAPRGGGLEEEALRVVRKMPKWKPGRQNGRDVAVFFTLPIRFSLEPQ